MTSDIIYRGEPWSVDSVGLACDLKVSFLRSEATESINAQYAPHKRENAALGLLPADETAAIRACITACRDTFHDLEARVEAIRSNPSLSLEEAVAALNAVAWP